MFNFVGAVLGMCLEEELLQHQQYGGLFFAALSGIFLYISMTSFFPVLQALIDKPGKKQFPDSYDMCHTAL